MSEASSAAEVAVYALTAMVFAAAWEEFFFRGFVQKLLTAYLRPWVAILLTAVVFALSHLQDKQVFFDTPVILFPLSLGLGYLNHRTQRLVGPMFLHLLYNSMTVLVVMVIREG
jgi:hypothetical protein